jgi:hypothetical protein
MLALTKEMWATVLAFVALMATTLKSDNGGCEAVSSSCGNGDSIGKGKGDGNSVSNSNGDGKGDGDGC